MTGILRNATNVRRTSSITRQIFVLALFPIMFGAPFFTGCANPSGRTPEETLPRFLTSWETGDWDSFKNSVVLGGKEISNGNENAAKEIIKRTKIRFDNIKMKTLKKALRRRP